MNSRRLPPALPVLTLLAMLGPVVAGLWGTLLPAFGHLPAAGLTGPSLDPFVELFDWAGLPRAAMLSVTTGLGATAVSLLIVTLITAGWSGTRAFRLLERMLSPLLSVPHAAAAFGLAFLIAPSGWLARLVSPDLTGWERPLDLLIVQDTWGLTMTAGLIAKEVPFLLLITLAALGQTDASRSLAIAQALGYGRLTGWLKTVFPRVYAQIRPPIYVVLAYSMSVVDVAVILGPNTPPTLSVQIVKLMSDPDLAMRLEGAAGALLQLSLVIGALVVWRLGEVAIGALGRRWIAAGHRGRLDPVIRQTALGLGMISALTIFLGIAVLAIWSFAGYWGFPDAFPDQLTFRNWLRHGPGTLEALGETALIAVTVSLVALILTIGCLEAEYRYGLPVTQRGIWLLYLPLLVPQTAFLPGLQTLMLQVGANEGRLPVMLAHLVFVLPYVFLSLADPFRAWDVRMGTVAAALRASPNGVLWRVRLPMLLGPILTALAVGMAVSVGQYLATLLIGGGRVETLTTEAVALSSGGDRRAIGVYGLMQTGAALVPFTLALLIPALVWRNRRGLWRG
ncbi:ABC transporter permease [Yoonia sediminilitoris]|uniref:Putative thiamine transport system permease protein n=1 Tax=Yoonia sediminilitoris TaxID=1286148 RepID=A0A2T6K8N0_9RHOB|nr:ABC transporter permease subunit [Yoonia sediminilitoris]PUB11073.1 putative thiamine transport system permease protein [Yoonia sediminilitoris]RCW90992.1 putative thiamine transport system permease protein [Yoonia sediminilitoris]